MSCGSGWLTALLLALPVFGQAPALSVRVVYHGSPTLRVGQPIDLDLVVVAGRARPVVTPPELNSATLAEVRVSLRPIASSGIGAVESQTNEYRIRYRLVPWRAGTLVIPPFRVESDGRTGATTPQRIEVKPVPAAGRPASWLGGVGALAATAEARPDHLRVGQSLELAVILEGNGALGSTASLDRSRIEALSIAPEVATLPDDLTLEPPRRVKRLRIRPTRPGEVSLPPLVVAWFDPRTGVYQTTATRAIPIRVVAAPPLDPARIAYGFREGDPATRTVVAVGVVVLILGGTLAWIIRRWRRARRRPEDAPAVARRLARELAEAPASGDPEAIARRVVEALGEYLEVARGRPRGVLTPAEARAAVGDPGLSLRIAALVENCDRVCYSGHPAETAAALVNEAREVLLALAETP